MEWVIAAIVVALLGLAALAGTGALGQLRPEPIRDVYRQPLPDHPLTASDLDAVRFGVTVRGYSMRQVDDLLDRLRDDLAGLESEVVRLRTGSGAVRPGTAAPDGIVAGPPDPFAAYQLDGGQGIPQTGPWHDGDGRPGVVTEDEPADTFRQYRDAEARNTDTDTEDS